MARPATKRKLDIACPVCGQGHYDIPAVLINTKPGEATYVIECPRPPRYFIATFDSRDPERFIGLAPSMGGIRGSLDEIARGFDT